MCNPIELNAGRRCRTNPEKPETRILFIYEALNGESCSCWDLNLVSLFFGISV